MSKLNSRKARGPITTEREPSLKTFEGAEGYRRDTRSDLFLLAVANFTGEETYYEGAVERDERYRNLVRAAAIADPDWVGGMIGWLRSEANMRAAPLVAAAEYSWARREAARDHIDAAEAEITTRKVVRSALGRLDEPGALINYWIKHYGRNIPKPIKRGAADAVLWLMNEYSYAKYDSDNAAVRLADVLNLTHPGDRKGSRQHFKGDSQHALFAYAVKKPYQPDVEPTGLTGPLAYRRALMEIPLEDRRSVLESPAALEMAGMTWEALAGWLQGPMDAAAWEAIVPSMGYMALLRNLRNLDEAGVSAETIDWVAAKIADPEEVANSKQFPYRFLAAYEAVTAGQDALHTSHWEPCLNTALTLSTRNIPALRNSRVLVDTSSSMTDVPFSARSKMTPAKAAAVFGVALAMKGDGNRLYGFASGVFEHELRPGVPFTRAVSDFLARTGEVGHGTEIAKAIRETYREGVERIIVITDEQTFGPHGLSRHGNVTDAAPAEVPIYVFNLGGYGAAMLPSTTNRHEFGVLTDAGFKMLSLIEAGQDADWPWIRTPQTIGGRA